MHYNTVYVGMDVHKKSFTLCCMTLEMEKAKYTIKTEADYKKILVYLDTMRGEFYGEDTHFVCGYEAGCLGYTLYHQLTAANVECVILAPSTMAVEGSKGKKRIKTDKRDAGNIAKCLAHHLYSPVHIPTDEELQIKEFIRMRDDHKHQLKGIKQQILAFCLRHGLKCDTSKSNWTIAHLNWLRSLELEPLYKEVLMEYLTTYEQLTEKIERFDKRIEQLAQGDDYKEDVARLRCFIGIETHTALSIIAEVGDFKRFADADKFASYLGLTPGEDTSSDNQNRLGITKAGNQHLRRLLTESAQCYGRGQTGYKSKALKARQFGNPTEVIAYADKANERLRRKYYKMVLNGKHKNTAKTAIARELACFIWGMMTNNIA